MKPELKKFFIFLLKGIAIILILDFIIGSGLSFLHSKMKGGERARAYYAINKSKADVYVFGSSRALYHYHTLILQDSLHLSVYNAGRSAQTMLYHLPVFKMILKRNKPKLVILDINENELVKEDRKYDLVNSLLPYYRQDEAIRQSVDFVKPGYRYFRWSNILPFNSSIFAILLRAVRPDKSETDINGYIAVHGHRIKGVSLFDNCNDKYEFDPYIISALEEFVKLCKDNNIKLQVVTSPRFVRAKCRKFDLEKVESELKRMNANYINMAANPKYLDKKEFMYDRAHLNYEGSIAFTKEIASYLKRAYKFD